MKMATFIGVIFIMLYIGAVRHDLKETDANTQPRPNAIVVSGRFPCEEDEWIAGTGDFDGKVGWDAYVCMHPDNA